MNEVETSGSIIVDKDAGAVVTDTAEIRSCGAIMVNKDAGTVVTDTAEIRSCGAVMADKDAGTVVNGTDEIRSCGALTEVDIAASCSIFLYYGDGEGFNSIIKPLISHIKSRNSVSGDDLIGCNP